MTGESIRLKTGDVIPASGIYRVHHAAHRLPHEVTLLKDEIFPRCQKCRNAVEFEPVLLAEEWRGMPPVRGIVIYELPVMSDAEAA